MKEIKLLDKYFFESSWSPSTESGDDSTDILDGTPTSNRSGKTKISDMVVHSVENLGHCPLGQSSKM